LAQGFLVLEAADLTLYFSPQIDSHR